MSLPGDLALSQLSWGKLRREPATRWFDWSFAPMPSCNDRFARQNRYRPPPEISPGFTFAWYSSPSFGSHPSCLRQTVRAYAPRLTTLILAQERISLVRVSRRVLQSVRCLGTCSSTLDGTLWPWVVRLEGFPFDNFTRWLHSLLKVLCTFPSRYFFAIAFP